MWGDDIAITSKKHSYPNQLFSWPPESDRIYCVSVWKGRNVFPKECATLPATPVCWNNTNCLQFCTGSAFNEQWRELQQGGKKSSVVRGKSECFPHLLSDRDINPRLILNKGSLCKNDSFSMSRAASVHSFLYPASAFFQRSLFRVWCVQLYMSNMHETGSSITGGGGLKHSNETLKHRIASDGCVWSGWKKKTNAKASSEWFLSGGSAQGNPDTLFESSFSNERAPHCVCRSERWVGGVIRDKGKGIGYEKGGGGEDDAYTEVFISFWQLWTLRRAVKSWPTAVPCVRAHTHTTENTDEPLRHKSCCDTTENLQARTDPARVQWVRLLSKWLAKKLALMTNK